MKNLDQEKESSVQEKADSMKKQRGQEPSWLTSWWTASSSSEQSDPWQSGLELA